MPVKENIQKKTEKPKEKRSDSKSKNTLSRRPESI